MAAGRALSATVATAGVTPGVGAPTANSPAVAASTPATIQATIETRPIRIPIRAAASPSSAAARIAMPQLEYLKRQEEGPDQDGRPPRSPAPGWW